ncbi:MAG: hypothetical protein EOO16_12455 [Chitinophagaceae bacterium]|nr:MAG: hypothetical protein EOO16_12455 [Chitinophagaceae bacterium]
MTSIQLHVKALKDQGEIVFSRMVIRHDGCVMPMTVRKPHGNERYTLECACGVQLALLGSEQMAITRTAIDLQQRQLDQAGVSVSAC